MDFLIIVPKIDSWQAGKAELEKIRGLKGIGYVFSDKLGSFENIIPIMSTGWGLARLYGMTINGVEAEFHIIGEKDAQTMPSLYPSSTKRIRPVSPKLELRTSFTGKRELLPKSGDRVPKYIIKNGINEEVYIGFFPLQIAITDFIYDPNDIGLQIQDKIWKALVKTFFYHNGVIEKTDEGLTVYLKKIPPFEDFLKIHYYDNPEKYSPERLEWMGKRYYKACKEVVNWYALRGLKVVLDES